MNVPLLKTASGGQTGADWGWFGLGHCVGSPGAIWEGQRGTDETKRGHGFNTVYQPSRILGHRWLRTARNHPLCGPGKPPAVASVNQDGRAVGCRMIAASNCRLRQ